MQHSVAHAHVQETVQLHERIVRVDVIDGSRRCSVDDADAARRHLKRGRKPHKIWIHFGKLPNPSGKTHPDSACLHCGEVIYNGKPSDNLKRHLLEHCDKITELSRMDVDKLFSKKQRVGDANPVEAGQAVQSQAVVLPRAPPYASQEAFERSYARHVYKHNLSWNLVNDAGYRKFYERMVPDSRLPTRQKLATSLLDAVHEEVMERAIKSIKKRKVVVRVTDSSMNPDRASMVNFVVVAPAMKPLLWASHVTGDEKYTDVTLNSKLEAVIDDIEAKTQATVVCVLTDDTDNENKSWQILEDRPIFRGGAQLTR